MAVNLDKNMSNDKKVQVSGKRPCDTTFDANEEDDKATKIKKMFGYLEEYSIIGKDFYDALQKLKKSSKICSEKLKGRITVEFITKIIDAANTYFLASVGMEKPGDTEVEFKKVDEKFSKVNENESGTFYDVKTDVVTKEKDTGIEIGVTTSATSTKEHE